jgi:hypothetical protein
MKKNKIFNSVVVCVLLFMGTLSCDDEQNEMPIKQNEISSVSNSLSKGSAKGRVSAPDFNGSEGDPIDLATAQEWAANYRSVSSNPDEILSHYFGFEIIQDILKQSSCVGIRIYYAIDETGEKKLILVGVDAAGENLLPVAGGGTTEGNIMADYSYPCPTYCPGNSL